MSADNNTPPDLFFGGVATLAEQLDKTIMVVLRDGRHLIGSLSSYDQYGSLVLENTRERHFAKGKFCDIAMGVYLVRGENIAICGEVVSVSLETQREKLQRAGGGSAGEG